MFCTCHLASLHTGKQVHPHFVPNQASKFPGPLNSQPLCKRSAIYLHDTSGIQPSLLLKAFLITAQPHISYLAHHSWCLVVLRGFLFLTLRVANVTPPRQLHLLSLWFLFAVVTVFGMVLIQCCHPEPKTPNTTFHSITDLYACYVFWLGSREKKALQRRPFAACAKIEHIPNLRIRPQEEAQVGASGSTV